MKMFRKEEPKLDIDRLHKEPPLGIYPDRGASHGHDDIVYYQTRKVEVPPAILQRNRLLNGKAVAEATTAYKLLRTHVLQRMRLNDWQTLAITSPGPGEGKTLTALNLAISLAREVNHTVLLVDLDMRRPMMARYLGHQPLYGLADYLLGDVPLQQIMITPNVERLVILPGKEPVMHSSELLSSPKMVRLVKELKERYESRLILFDMPPLLVADDMLAFAPNIDAVLMVVQEGKTKKDQLKRAVEMLEGIKVLGTVLNQSAELGHGYY